MDRSANSQQTNISETYPVGTAHGFIRFLARMMDYQTDFPVSNIEQEAWESLEVGEPAGNTVIVTINEKQYIVSVKPVSK